MADRRHPETMGSSSGKTLLAIAVCFTSGGQRQPPRIAPNHVNARSDPWLPHGAACFSVCTALAPRDAAPATSSPTRRKRFQLPGQQREGQETSYIGANVSKKAAASTSASPDKRLSPAKFDTGRHFHVLCDIPEGGAVDAIRRVDAEWMLH
jgi:hypothetical protein